MSKNKGWKLNFSLRRHSSVINIRCAIPSALGTILVFITPRRPLLEAERTRLQCCSCYQMQQKYPSSAKTTNALSLNSLCPQNHHFSSLVCVNPTSKLREFHTFYPFLLSIFQKLVRLLSGGIGFSWECFHGNSCCLLKFGRNWPLTWTPHLSCFFLPTLMPLSARFAGTLFE